MRTSTALYVTVLVYLTVVGPPLAAQYDQVCRSLSEERHVHTNQADIRIKGYASSEGQFVCCVIPRKTIPQDVVVRVQRGWSPTRIAREIKEILEHEFGLNYNIKWNAKKAKVTMTKTKRSTRFALLCPLDLQTASGIRIKIDYD